MEAVSPDVGIQGTLVLPADIGLGEQGTMGRTGVILTIGLVLVSGCGGSTTVRATKEDLAQAATDPTPSLLEPTATVISDPTGTPTPASVISRR